MLLENDIHQNTDANRWGIKHGQEVGGSDTPAAQTRAVVLQGRQARPGRVRHVWDRLGKESVTGI